MNIRKLQQQAAASSDELLDISRETGRYVIEAYGTVPREIFDMQCRLQLARCARLEEKLRGIQEELAAAGQGAPGAADACPEGQKQREERAPGGGQTDSAAVTRQMVAQNLLILAQKQELLNGFLAHSDAMQSRLDEARKMNDTAETIRLRNTLRGELALCRTEKER